MNENDINPLAAAIHDLANAIRVLAAAYGEGEVMEQPEHRFESLDDA